MTLRSLWQMSEAVRRMMRRTAFYAMCLEGMDAKDRRRIDWDKYLRTGEFSGPEPAPLDIFFEKKIQAVREQITRDGKLVL